MNLKRMGYIFLFLYVVITVLIFCNSLRDADLSTEQSSVIVRIIENIVIAIGKMPDTDAITFSVRKAAHFIEFAAQSGMLGLFFIFTSDVFRNKIIYILFSGLLTACIDEFLQIFPAGRSSQVSDVFVDFTGAVAAVLVCILIFNFKRKRRFGAWMDSGS